MSEITENKLESFCEFVVTKDGAGGGNPLVESSNFYNEKCGEPCEHYLCAEHSKPEYEEFLGDECGLCGTYFDGEGCPVCFRKKE